MQFDDQHVFGFDISKWQALYDNNTGEWRHVDFQRMKEYGASFVICKAGQYNYTDYAFEHNWKEAKRIGIPRASYWFLDYRDTGRLQAQRYWDLLKSDPGEGPLVVDFESGSGGDWQVLYDFIAELQSLSNYPDEKIWIYTGYSYWIEHSPLFLAQRLWFSKYPLWLAYYTEKPEHAQVPDTWTECVMWQKGTPSIGLEVGAHSKEIDYDLLNGKELSKYFTGAIPNDGNGEPMSDYIELKSALNSNHSIRRPTAYPQTPHIIGTAFSTPLQAGTTIQCGPEDFYLYASDITYLGIKQAYQGDKWWRVMIGSDVGWIAEKHKGVTYLTARLVQVTPPPPVVHTVDVMIDGVNVFHTELS
jgi:GH25 family lysozyme M1 (1,4-beta-N-acetylmuramidase)